MVEISTDLIDKSYIKLPSHAIRKHVFLFLSFSRCLFWFAQLPPLFIMYHDQSNWSLCYWIFFLLPKSLVLCTIWKRFFFGVWLNTCPDPQWCDLMLSYIIQPLYSHYKALSLAFHTHNWASIYLISSLPDNEYAAVQLLINFIKQLLTDVP